RVGADVGDGVAVDVDVVAQRRDLDVAAGSGVDLVGHGRRVAVVGAGGGDADPDLAGGDGAVGVDDLVGEDVGALRLRVRLVRHPAVAGGEHASQLRTGAQADEPDGVTVGVDALQGDRETRRRAGEHALDDLP